MSLLKIALASWHLPCAMHSRQSGQISASNVRNQSSIHAFYVQIPLPYTRATALK